MDSNKIIKGIKWAGIQFVLDTIFRFSIRLILVKLLLPSEFGLVAMCLVFIVVAEASSELGMGAALIQKKEDKEVINMYSTAFWSGIIWGIFVYLIMSLAVSPLASNFYNEPILLKLVPILSLGILFKPLCLIHTVILTRAMNFRKIAKISNISSLIAGTIGIFAAYLDYGVWALVINYVFSIALTVPLFFFATRWKPKLLWNRVQFKEIFGFGAYSTGTSIFSTITYNIDNLMIGKILGATSLGIYTLSFSLTEYLRQIISNVLNKVMFPVFGKSQDDKEKLRNYFLRILNINALVIYPIMTFLLLFSTEIVTGFFGEKWTEAIVPLRVLSIAVMVHLMVNSFTSLIRGLGKPKLEMQIIIGLTLFVLLPGLFLGISFFGLTGAAFAILINKVALVITGLTVLKKEIALPITAVLAVIKGAMSGILVSSGVVLVLKYYLHLNNILILAPIYIFLYLGIIYMMEKDNLQNILKKFL